MCEAVGAPQGMLMLGKADCRPAQPAIRCQPLAECPPPAGAQLLAITATLHNVHPAHLAVAAAARLQEGAAVCAGGGVPEAGAAPPVG